jgi:hypothetical protein
MPLTQFRGKEKLHFQNVGVKSESEDKIIIGVKIGAKNAIIPFFTIVYPLAVSRLVPVFPFCIGQIQIKPD